MNQLLGALLLVAPLTMLNAKEIPWNGNDEVIGDIQIITSKYEYTFVDLGESYNFGYNELVSANPLVDAWLPGDGQPLIMPGQHILPSGQKTGVVINLAEYRLYYFKSGSVLTYPIGIGITEAPTPVVSSKIVSRTKLPTWYPPEGVRARHLADGHILPRVVPPGPDNPLGPFALKLSEDGYLIHGTNKQIGIGMQVSGGCIRMYNPDITEFVMAVALGTNVRIIDEPVKLAVFKGSLLLEVHANEDTDKSTLEGLFYKQLEVLEGFYSAPDKRQSFSFIPEAIRNGLQDISGIPVVIGRLNSPDSI